MSLTVTIALTLLVFLSMAGFIIYFLFQYRYKQLSNQQEQENLKLEFQGELLHAKMEIQEATLAEVAREIHDNVGQMLSVAKLYMVSPSEDSSPNSPERTLKAYNAVTSAIAALRDLVASMNPDGIESLGLVGSLQRDAEKISTAGFFELTVESQGESWELDKQHTIILYRMCQELINNAIKHGEATLIAISFSWNFPVLKIKLADNGKGFDPLQLSSSGQGLMNLNKRAKILGAAFSIQSSPGKGTTAEIIIGTTEHGIG